jgi:hypothetical protein
MKRYDRIPEAREILIAARLHKLRGVAARTTVAFDNAKLRTDLSRAEVAAQLLRYLDHRWL